MSETETVTFRLTDHDLALLDALRDTIDAERQELGQIVPVTRSDALRWAIRNADYPSIPSR